MASIVLRLLLLSIYLIGVTRLGVDYSSLGQENSDGLANGNGLGAREGRWSAIQIGANATSSASITSDESSTTVSSSSLQPANEWPLLMLASLCVIVNALTVLDVALSRQTKPWRFLLRIVYRFGRANLKLSPVLLMFYASSQLDCLNVMTQFVSEFARYATDCQYVRQMVSTCENHAKWLGIAFFAYAVLIRWTSLSFFGRRPAGETVNEAEARSSSWSSGMSRWWLLIECIFRPVSLATAHTLADFDLELDETMDLFFERLVFPNLWLTPTIPADYLSYLPVWKSSDADDFEPPSSDTMKWISSNECAICLDKYRVAVDVCGLPCGHHFHEPCIMSWLERDNHHCPICRWPAYRNKHLEALPYDLSEASQVAA